jgi:hypothetical protein
MTVEDCTTYIKAEDAGYRRYNNPADPAQKILRAFNIETGSVAWQIILPGPLQSNYSGVRVLRRKQRGICCRRRSQWKVSLALRDQPCHSRLTYDLRNRWPTIHRHRIGD